MRLSISSLGSFFEFFYLQKRVGLVQKEIKCHQSKTVKKSKKYIFADVFQTPSNLLNFSPLVPTDFFLNQVNVLIFCGKTVTPLKFLRETMHFLFGFERSFGN